tara:strand:- start:103 stop:777 length:675 start_codon:yes stop_codon:yes gene_type:complete
MKIFIKILFYFFSIVTITGCSSVNLSERIAPGYSEALLSVSRAIFGYKSEPFSKELIYQIPYASMTTKIGKGPEGLMILESVRDKKELWISADKIYFTLLNGRIISTKGLENNLSNLETSYEVNDLSKLNVSLNYKHYYSFDNPEVHYLEVEVSYKNLGSELVDLFDRKIKLNLIEEELHNKYLGWKVKNRFWYDSEGFIWKSEQHLSPKLPMIKIEVTKKPSM